MEETLVGANVGFFGNGVFARSVLQLDDRTRDECLGSGQEKGPRSGGLDLGRLVERALILEAGIDRPKGDLAGLGFVGPHRGPSLDRGGLLAGRLLGIDTHGGMGLKSGSGIVGSEHW